MSVCFVFSLAGFYVNTVRLGSCPAFSCFAGLCFFTKLILYFRTLYHVTRFVKILEDYINKGGEFSEGTPNVAVHSEKLKKSFNKNFVTTVKIDKDKINFNSSTDSSAGEGLDGEASVLIPGSVFPTNSTANVTVIVVYYKSSVLFSPDFRKTEVCKDGFTADQTVEGRKRSSSYTVENITGDIVTESSPVLAASLRNMHVANLSSPVIIKFKMPPDEVRLQHTHARTHARTHAQTHLPTYLHTYLPTCMHTYIHTYIHTYMHARIHTHTYIHTYIHTYVHTYILYKHLIHFLRLYFMIIYSCIFDEEINNCFILLINLYL